MAAVLFTASILSAANTGDNSFEAALSAIACPSEGLVPADSLVGAGAPPLACVIEILFPFKKATTNASG